MKTPTHTVFLLVLMVCAALTLATPTTTQAQTSVPVYTTVVADSWSYWLWDCWWSDYHYDYDWWWGPSWYGGFDWYNGYDWTWTPNWWWYDYLYYYSCYYVWVEIWGTSLVQVPNTSAACTYVITVTFSDSSTQTFNQTGNGGAINLYFTHAASDAVPTSAIAIQTCGGTPDVRITYYGTDVTDGTTTMAIGEVAQFTVEPGPNSPGLAITGVQWPQPSNAYKSYTFTLASGAPVGLSAQDLTSSTFHLFFASPRNQEELVATVATNQGQVQVKTKVTVLAPGSSFTTSTGTPQVAFTGEGNGLLIFGANPPGISFSYSVDGGAGAGSYFLIQVVNSESASGICDSNEVELSYSDTTPRIDTTQSVPDYPLESDSPSMTLHERFHTMSVQHQFTTYVMFQSSASASHPVAVRKVNWGWSATATLAGMWQLNGETHSVNPGSVAVFELPSWTGQPPGHTLGQCPGGGGGGPNEP